MKTIWVPIREPKGEFKVGVYKEIESEDDDEDEDLFINCVNKVYYLTDW